MKPIFRPTCEHLWVASLHGLIYWGSRSAQDENLQLVPMRLGKHVSAMVSDCGLQVLHDRVQ